MFLWRQRRFRVLYARRLRCGDRNGMRRKQAEGGDGRIACLSVSCGMVPLIRGIADGRRFRPNAIRTWGPARTGSSDRKCGNGLRSRRKSLGDFLRGVQRIPVFQNGMLLSYAVKTACDVLFRRAAAREPFEYGWGGRRKSGGSPDRRIFRISAVRREGSLRIAAKRRFRRQMPFRCRSPVASRMGGWMEIGGSDRKPADARGGVLPRRGIYVDRTYAAAMDQDAAEAPGASKNMCVAGAWAGIWE